MNYDFSKSYSSYLLKEIVKSYLLAGNIEDEKVINIIYNLLLGNESIIDICQKLDLDFNKLLTIKLQNNGIVLTNVESRDKKNNVRKYIEFYYHSSVNENHNYRYMIEQDSKAKIKYMKQALTNADSFKELEGKKIIKEYIKVLKEIEKQEASINLIYKHFALKKLEKEKASLETNLTVHSYKSMIDKKEFFDIISNINNELQETELDNAQEIINKKIEQNNLNLNYVSALEEEHNAYVNLHKTVTELKEKIISFEKENINLDKVEKENNNLNTVENNLENEEDEELTM